MQTESEVRAHILMRATEDEAFRARLLADPKGTVEAEAGVSFPADYTFHVHEGDRHRRPHDPAYHQPTQPSGPTGPRRGVELA